MPPSCKVAAAVVPGHCLKKGPIYSGGSSDDCDLLLDLLQDDQDEDNDQEMEDLMSSVNLEDSANFLDLSLSNHNDDAADALPTTTTVGHNLPLFSYCDSLYDPKHHVYVWDDEFSLLHKAKTHKLCRVQEEDEEDQEEDCHLYLGNKKEVWNLVRETRRGLKPVVWEKTTRFQMLILGHSWGWERHAMPTCLLGQSFQGWQRPVLSFFVN